MRSLRREALLLLLTRDVDMKTSGVLQLDTMLDIDSTEILQEPPGLPGRPPRPTLVAPGQLKPRSVATLEGRAALLHALAHIELNAVDLALDLVWRFGGLPAIFYRDWVGVARDEARHFGLLREHLRTLGYEYGDFHAHNGLWEMAEKTKHDLLARLALVPRTLEARGLDASPAIRDKLLRVGDEAGARILETILRDEIGHVRLGNVCFRELCKERGLEPVATHAQLAQHYGAPRPRGPFNLEARRAAGFDDDELVALSLSNNAAPSR